MLYLLYEVILTKYSSWKRTMFAVVKLHFLKDLSQPELTGVVHWSAIVSWPAISQQPLQTNNL